MYTNSEFIAYSVAVAKLFYANCWGTNISPSQEKKTYLSMHCAIGQHKDKKGKKKTNSGV